MTFDWSVITNNWPLLLQGAGMTVLLAAASMALAIPGGLLLALARMSSFAPIRILATAFVEFFRTTPVMLQVYWVFYVLPVLTEIRVDAFSAGLVALACNVSAFNSETFRSGINSIRAGQRQAALALGMSEAEAMWHVILPQAVRRVLPALASTWVSLFKDTSLVSIIAVAELSYVGLQLRSQTFRVLEVLTAMAVLYWLMGYPQAKLTDWIHRKFKVTE
ncbi:amino acid ABC transporter permease [Devosia faecipullorum]|uniref:amino acid ABC transporter permease n=1 Tax=Devosia faecipullorum TaxID=2755039 RepID=UPI00187B649E|nr:amino acid ABC transporter permease [Devosia faecipullorum]MBE7733337.1 amino acid ABC transporter permease [Devosia faecipullorum]